MHRSLLRMVLMGLLLVPRMLAAAEAPPAPPPSVSPPPAPPPAPPAPNADALRADLDKILASAGLGNMIVAIRVLDLGEPGAVARRDVLYSARADVPLIPASTMKLVTTAACLDRFGPEWRLRTHVGRLPAGDRKDAWDLGVIGGGDPNLSGRFYGGDTIGALRQWAAILKQRGVTAVERVLLDDTLFDPVLQHPNWPADQRAKWYEAPASALPINDNCVDVHVAPGEVGRPARIWLEPPGDYATIEGAITTVADRKQHRFGLERIVDDAGGMRIRASGAFWAQAQETIENRAMADPTLAFGAALVYALRAEGLAVAGPIMRARLTDAAGALRPDFVCDLVHTSPLAATVAVTNKRSQGLYAECLLKLLGAFGPTPKTAALVPRQGSWANGTEEARRWMAERGIAADGCVIDDGSGLSKENRLTAFCVSELLACTYARFGETFVQTLSVAGDDGSLGRRMRGTAAEGRVYGKTGYVLGASALSGYVKTQRGRVLVYSILMNDMASGALWKARLAQDKICIRLVDY